MLRGWWPFYRTSVGLGLRSFAAGHFTREALIRVGAPLEDARFFELPATVAALDVQAGQRVLDLASPKLAAVSLARSGARVTSVDLFESEVETWRSLTGHIGGLDLQVADGRRLPFEDGSFDHAYSISVLEHIGDDGDCEALAELVRVVRPGGRIVLTVPYDTTYSEDWRDAPLYGEEVLHKDGKWFFQRTYDERRLTQLVSSVSPLVKVIGRRATTFAASRLYDFYRRTAPASLVLGPLMAVTVRVIEGTPGLMLLTLVRLSAPRSAEGGDSRIEGDALG